MPFRLHVGAMFCLRISSDAGKAVALARLFERYGCRVLDCRADELEVGFPEASNESEAFAEARLYLSMRPPVRGPFRLAVASGAS